MTRAKFFWISLFFIIVGNLTTAYFFQNEGPYAIFVLISLIILIIISIKRLQNIGISSWWALLIFIPIINLFFWFFLLFKPPMDARKKEIQKKISDHQNELDRLKNELGQYEQDSKSNFSMKGNGIPKHLNDTAEAISRMGEYNFKNITTKSIQGSAQVPQELKAIIQGAGMCLMLATWHKKNADFINDPYVIGYVYGFADKINQASNLKIGSVEAKSVVDSMYASIFDDWDLAFKQMIEYTELANPTFQSAVQDGGDDMGLVVRKKITVAEKLLNHMDSNY